MHLIWFRNDLRLHDHAALWHAAQSRQCLALVILSPEQWQLHQDAPIKIDFYLRRLKVLKQQLEALNIPLLILNIPRWKDIPDQFLSLCQQFQISTVHCNIETGFNEQQRDQAVEQLLQQHQIAFESYEDRTLFPLGSIRNQNQQPYQVFSAFKKKCYERLIIDVPSCYPEIEAQPKLEFDLSSFDFDLDKFAETYQQEAISRYWPIEDQHAFEMLNEFIEDRLVDYKIDRDLPSIDGTSQLSPHLNIGILSIRECVQSLFASSQGYFQIENEGQQTWLDELLWREFYQHTLHDFPKVSKHQPFKDNTKAIVWRDAPEDLAAWQQGQTGIPIVDAGMHQLLATGWMHNRVRMITAMFLSKNLLIDWRLGEAWFMQHLIDGDLAANNGGWQWCTSTGMDAVPYFRIFNPVNQSQRFDPNGDYLRKWVPELAHLDSKSIHEPYAKNPDLQLDYPKPIVDLKQSRIRAIEAFKQL
ncbi:deoxyribodipyrimidine photolyase [Acinetobacter sp. LoGeW2-3]|uniref:cryptochrome/photolyase family protein n=1 Tax=Acinetobacter sp. LoGeW2-3 TaxID=1808001 RepID=UPI000C05A202|nr:deoxyribodipyrimidine photo-lyase [Acinetobacter sp. LoGeW2-3]ATO18974.1 deoxyribodipyrimidine photolyase [Acinetobacter sp. LoGeW2-3]